MLKEKMRRKKVKFCERNKRELLRLDVVRSTKGSGGWWKTPRVVSLIYLARKEIGYSPKTIDMDIINGLIKQANRM